MRRNTKIMIIVYITIFTTWIPASFIWADLWNHYYWSFLIGGFLFFGGLTYIGLSFFGERAVFKRQLRAKKLDFNKISGYFK